MHVYAGKTHASRYDHRAPVHLAVTEEDADGAIATIRAICTDKPIWPIRGSAVDITCSRCQEVAVSLLQDVS